MESQLSRIKVFNCLKDIQSFIVNVFDQQPIEHQPKYIADASCDNGDLLKQVYQTICQKTQRGQQLEQYPIQLVAIAPNQKLLQKIRLTLKSLPYISFLGDIDQPEELLLQLASEGIKDTQNILFMCIVSNFNSQHRSSSNKKNQPPCTSNLTSYLQAWSRTINKHGLLLSAFHELSLNANQSDLSNYVVEAESFLITAAKVGLFCRNQGHRYPRTSRFVQVTTNHFEHRDYIVRYAQIADLPRLVELERQCWPEQLIVTEAELAHRIETYFHGQFVLEMQGTVVGVVYSQRIRDVAALKKTDSSKVSKLHDAQGTIIQLLAINIAIDKQQMRLGDQLLEFMLQRCALVSGVDTVVGVTRCQDYGKHDDMPVARYITMTNEHGQFVDSVLRFHQLHGGEITEIVANYRPLDALNQGNGVLVVYDIHHRKRRDIQIGTPATQQANSSIYEGSAADFVQNNIQQILGLSKQRDYQYTRPLMEMGLNSTDILKLSEVISTQYCLELEPMFFFHHNTPKSIAEYLKEQTENQLKHDSKSTQNHIKKSISKHDIVDKIAVIGIAGRFPGANNKEALWEILESGQSAVSRLPAGRFEWPSFLNIAQQQGVDYGGFLDDITHFDAEFFRISPKEAELMDPQQRILLELSWAAIEDSGCRLDSLSKESTGVFIGASGSDYSALLKDSIAETESFFSTGTATSLLANRISYFYNLTGPSMQIDTACSSSLVAIHEAVKALRTEECQHALAGGIHIMCHPSNTLSYYKAGMLAKDGRCKTFDKKADGYVRGEGAGILLLKPLSQAIKDGNHVYGIIQGSAVNHGGQASGLTVPNPKKQAQVLIDAYQDANVQPEAVDYIEAHGTGTSLGDPIEIEGLKEAFSRLSQRSEKPAKSWCGIGSVKTNIGHLEAAAGVAGVIKVLLSMKQQTIPASINFTELNPKIRLSSSAFHIADKKKDWKPNTKRPRIAGVSSFGFGGANAHVVLKDYVSSQNVENTVESNTDQQKLFVLSAKNSERLDEYISKMIAFLEGNQIIDLDAFAYTLMTCREPMEQRFAAVFTNHADLLSTLRATRNRRKNQNSFSGHIKDGVSLKKLFDDDQEDSDLLTALKKKWLEQKNVTKLAQLWVQGENICWDFLYDDNYKPRPRPINSLPTYPFAKEHHWFVSLLPVPTALQVSQRQQVCLSQHWYLSDIQSTMQKDINDSVVILFAEQYCKLAKTLQISFPRAILIEESKIEALKQLTDIQGIIDLSTTVRTKLPLLQKLIRKNTQGFKLFYITDATARPLVDAGLYKMLQSEYRYVISRHVVFEHTDQWAQYISFEWQHQQPETQVAYKANHRYLPRLKYIQKPSVPLQLSQDTVLWITGGTRGLGLLCAQHIVEYYGVKKLVLHGRSQSSTDYLSVINKLTANGVRIKVLFTPITDLVQLQQDVLEVNNTLGKVGMILHCAGTLDRQTPAFIHKLPEKIQATIEPKVSGLENLHQAMFNQPVKKFVLFSSVSSALPSLGAGQSDYAMANNFMDDWARYQHQQGNSQYLSLQWPSWKESGIGEINTIPYQKTGLLTHSDAEGLALLDLSLGYDEPVILPAIVNPSCFDVNQLLKDKISTTSANTTPNVIQSALSIETNVNSLSLFDRTTYWLQSLLGNLLKLPQEKIEIEAPFQEFGVDSIVLAQFVVQIDPALDGKLLDPSVMLQYPTISELTNYLLQKHPIELEQHFGKITNSTKYVQMSMMDLAPTPNFVTQSSVLTDQITTNPQQQNQYKIAVVGVGCHFPDATGTAQYWQNLMNAKDSIRKVPDTRWNLQKFYQTGNYVKGKSISCWGAFLKDIESFDPSYFGISESLAPQLDPLERQWLEVSAEALADAGFDKRTLWGKNVGVFAGSRVSNFSAKFKFKDYNKDTIIGFGQNFITAHLAHIYNFKGPNIVVDAACASSLTAIHLAVQSLKCGESEVALAGGVDILLDETPYITLSAAQVLSPDGKCKTFDEKANGIGLGEGCGVIILKRLEDAIQNGDKIYAVIEGSAINNDGNTMGVTTPNPEAQQVLVAKAINDAGIAPETIGYIEAHGTGTLIGDPIELKGLSKIFENSTHQKQFCGVGSVKSNIGHLLSASGVAGVIKVLLSIIHRKLPPTLHCHTPNPRFNFKESPFYPVLTAQAWEADVHRAGISAFGLGGNNAHIVLSDQGIPGNLLASTVPKIALPNFQKNHYWPISEHLSYIDLPKEIILEDPSLFELTN